MLNRVQNILQKFPSLTSVNISNLILQSQRTMSYLFAESWDISEVDCVEKNSLTFYTMVFIYSVIRFKPGQNLHLIWLSWDRGSTTKYASGKQYLQTSQIFAPVGYRNVKDKPGPALYIPASVSARLVITHILIYAARCAYFAYSVTTAIAYLYQKTSKSTITSFWCFYNH